MNQRLRWKGLWFGFVLFAFITSCAPVVQDAPALDASPSPESADISFEVTYDGKGCLISGPEEVPAGNYQFIIKNLTDEKIDFWVSILKDGKTYQDLLDRQGEPGVYKVKPSWATHDPKIYRGWNEELNGFEITIMLFDVGVHATYLGPINKDSLWFCAPLTVVEAPSE